MTTASARSALLATERKGTSLGGLTRKTFSSDLSSSFSSRLTALGIPRGYRRHGKLRKGAGVVGAARSSYPGRKSHRIDWAGRPAGSPRGESRPTLPFTQRE